MKNTDHTKKRLLKEAHQMVKDLYDVGVADIATMREFDALCILETHDLYPDI